MWLLAVQLVAGRRKNAGQQTASGLQKAVRYEAGWLEGRATEKGGPE
jgi:hypothetical protein